MFLLDTDVVSELLRTSPNAVVESWIDGHWETDLYFSAIGEAELRYGVAILPAGRRKTALASAIDAILQEDFVDRVLPFDSSAAREYADMAAACRSVGHPAPQADCQIAAIARSRDMLVATRNTRDFGHLDVEVINPWTTN